MVVTVLALWAVVALVAAEQRRRARAATARAAAEQQRLDETAALLGVTRDGDCVRGVVDGFAVEYQGITVRVRLLRPLPSPVTLEARGEGGWDYHRYEDYGQGGTGDAPFDADWATAALDEVRGWPAGLRAALVAHRVPEARIVEGDRVELWTLSRAPAEMASLVRGMVALAAAIDAHLP